MKKKCLLETHVHYNITNKDTRGISTQSCNLLKIATKFATTLTLPPWVKKKKILDNAVQGIHLKQIRDHS